MFFPFNRGVVKSCRPYPRTLQFGSFAFLVRSHVLSFSRLRSKSCEFNTSNKCFLAWLTKLNLHRSKHTTWVMSVWIAELEARSGTLKPLIDYQNRATPFNFVTRHSSHAKHSSLRVYSLPVLGRLISISILTPHQKLNLDRDSFSNIFSLHTPNVSSHAFPSTTYLLCFSFRLPSWSKHPTSTYQAIDQSYQSAPGN